jgi:hypothetical protein
VDPAQQLIEAFRNVDDEWIKAGKVSGVNEIRLPPFEAVEIRSPWDW